MIWCLIGITLFILAFVFNKLEDIYLGKYRDTEKDSYGKASDVFDVLCAGSLIISLIVIAISSTLRALDQ